MQAAQREGEGLMGRVISYYSINTDRPSMKCRLCGKVWQIGLLQDETLQAIAVQHRNECVEPTEKGDLFGAEMVDGMLYGMK